MNSTWMLFGSSDGIEEVNRVLLELFVFLKKYNPNLRQSFACKKIIEIENIKFTEFEIEKRDYFY